LILALLTCGAASRSAAGESAAQIIETAGIQGGLVVHVGCGDGEFTAALHLNDRYLVHGLDTDAENVAAARKRLSSLGLSGPVSADRFDGQSLPYADNLVNLLVADDLGSVPMEEVIRVLAPRGVAMIGGRKVVKPWPAEIDEWTHFLHDASGNAVARDRRVGSPRHLQWTAGPERTRDHDALASISAMTTSGGRLFCIVDEGATSLVHRPPDWKLVARDAFNGVPLWKRDVPEWVTHLFYFRSGPAQLPRRLVSIGDRVYVTLGLDAAVTALDAATGRTLITFADSRNTEEILCHDGTLLALVGDPDVMNEEAPKVFGYWELSVDRAPTAGKSIVAYEAATGKVLWRKAEPSLAYLAPLSLTAFGDRVFYLDNENLRCVALADGRELWKAAFPTEGLFLRNYAPTVVACNDAVMCLTWDRLWAFSPADGSTLWAFDKGSIGFASPGDLFVTGGLAWTVPQTASIWKDNKLDREGKIASGVPIPTQQFLGNGGREIWGIDVRTGEVARTISEQEVLPGGHHHRCYRNKATERYLICGRRGLEYVSLDSDDYVNNWWVRGICQYGVMPANGYIYVPPDPCQCFNLIKVNGFLAMSADSSLDELDTSGGGTLERGPAYGQITRVDSQEIPQSGAADAEPPSLPKGWQPPVAPDRRDEWPTFRGNITRSGSTGAPVSARLKTEWQARIGGQLSACVVADGKLLVSAKDTNTVHCRDAATGGELWHFTAGGAVDSPPSVEDGLCVFGSRDGAVYCLRLADGEPGWRFRAAPLERRIVADGRLESVWPIHGSVLVQDGTVYFAAGRSSYLDGGIRLFGVDLRSGKELCRTTISAVPVGSGNLKEQSADSTGALPDVLVCDGRAISMRHLQFDLRLDRQDRLPLGTLCATTGLLEDTWFHRQSWVLAPGGRINPATVAPSLGSRKTTPGSPVGKLISFGAEFAYTVTSPYTLLKHTPSMQPANQDGHLHQKYSRYAAEDFPTGTVISATPNSVPAVAAAGKAKRSPPEPASEIWSKHDLFQPRAMLLAGKVLFLAGWRDAVAIHPTTGRPLNPDNPDPRPSLLRAMATADGETLAEYPLEAEPVFDGMAAAWGRLYVPLKDGTILCLGSSE
jgi:outer membrane protein assembly factor BamB